MANSPETSFGDTEQFRLITAQVAEAAILKFAASSDMVTKEFVLAEDVKLLDQVKSWLTRLALGWLVTASPMIFFLGGIWTDQRAALELQREQQVTLSQRGEWMEERVRWEMSIETWAETNGYNPPRYVRDRNTRRAK